MAYPARRPAQAATPRRFRSEQPTTSSRVIAHAAAEEDDDERGDYCQGEEEDHLNEAIDEIPTSLANRSPGSLYRTRPPPCGFAVKFNPAAQLPHAGKRHGNRGLPVPMPAQQGTTACWTPGSRCHCGCRRCRPGWMSLRSCSMSAGWPWTGHPASRASTSTLPRSPRVQSAPPGSTGPPIQAPADPSVRKQLVS